MSSFYQKLRSARGRAAVVIGRCADHQGVLRASLFQAADKLCGTLQRYRLPCLCWLVSNYMKANVRAFFERGIQRYRQCQHNPQLESGPSYDDDA